MKIVKATQDTKLKLSSKDSSSLTPAQYINIPKGEVLELESVVKEGNHYKATMTVYLFEGHWEVAKEDRDIPPDTPKDSGSSSGGSGGELLSRSKLVEFFGRQLTEQQFKDLDRCLKTFNITTRPRLLHFLSQVHHESGGLRYTKELWGPTRAQQGYEGRGDLGNTQKGDGFRFRGK